jgi:nucleotide sugar dehydrogenase
MSFEVEKPLKAAVVGLGRVGLPIAVQYARAGYEVCGADLDSVVVEQVGRGVAPFTGETMLAEYLADVVSSGRLTATTDTSSAVGGCDVVVVIVPLRLDSYDEPDFTSVDRATTDTARGLRKGHSTLVIYETTFPIGTTRERCAPLLEDVSGLTAGEDFDVVYSPERVLVGRVFADLRRYPKLVGGLSDKGSARARRFYEQALTFDHREDLHRPNGVWELASAETAEMTKLAEAAYRDVNIALANQLAIHAQARGVDVHEVIGACNSQPYSSIHAPGISVGGHCIPVYPHLYLWTDPDASLVRISRDVNAGMPERMVGVAIEASGGSLEDKRVLVLGVSYRGDVKEPAFSGAFQLVELLRRQGAGVAVSDPLFSDSELRGLGLEPHLRGDRVDVVMVHTDHTEFRSLGAVDFPGVAVIVDGRNILDPGRFLGPGLLTLGRNTAPVERRGVGPDAGE